MDSLLHILYVGIRNTLDVLHQDAFYKSNNHGNPQIEANLQLKQIKKRGILAGSIACQVAPGVISYPKKNDDAIVGIFVSDALMDDFDTIGHQGSHKGTYAFGMGTLETNIYETHCFLGTTNIVNKYTIGANLWASQNGILTVKEGLECGNPELYGIIIGVVTKSPTSSDPILRFNLRI